MDGEPLEECEGECGESEIGMDDDEVLEVGEKCEEAPKALVSFVGSMTPDLFS